MFYNYTYNQSIKLYEDRFERKTCLGKKLPSGNKTEKNLSRIPSCENKFKKLLMKKEI